MQEGMPDILRWTGDALRFLDQTALPSLVRIEETRDYRTVIKAIKALQIRGAPLLGIAGAYAALLAALEVRGQGAFREDTLFACDRIAAARPTAVNLRWSNAPPLCEARRTSTSVLRGSNASPSTCMQTMRSVARTLAATGQTSCHRARASSRIATPARWPRAAKAPPSR
jgi:methylthioribose-1-phosphate isomerase